MKLRPFLLLSIVATIWVAILVVLVIITPDSTYTGTFIDYLHHMDVSGEYSLSINPIRTLFEPFYYLVMFMAQNSNFIPTLLISYLVCRIILQIYRRAGYHDKMDEIVAKLHLNEIRSIYTKSVFYMLLIIIIGFILSYFIFGFITIGHYGTQSLVLLSRISTTLLIIILVLSFSTVIFPNNPISQKFTSLFQKLHTAILQRKHARTQKKQKNSEKTQRSTGRLAQKLRYESGLIFSVLIFGGLMLVGSLSIAMPTDIIETDLAPNEVLFDFHVHTFESDGYVPPSERVDWYIRHGISGAAFSDHHNTQGAREALAYVERKGLNFTVLYAQEYTISVPRVHLNIFGLTEDINPPLFLEGIDFKESSLFPGSILNVSDMITYVKSQGGYVTVNHYPNEDPYTWAQFRDWGVDGFEIVNGGSEQNPALTQFCMDNDLICIGGSDIHDNIPLDTFVRFQLDDPQNRSVDAIFSALKSNDHEVVSIQRSVLYSDSQSPSPFSTKSTFKQYFWAIPPENQASWIIWSVIIYVICYAGFVILKKRIST